MKIFICEIDTPKYTVTGVGRSAQEARDVADGAARKHLTSFDVDTPEALADPFGYYGGNETELVTGKAYLDGGKAGEVR